jgi:hypothetical protein
MSQHRGPRTVTHDTVRWRLIAEDEAKKGVLGESDLKRLAAKHDIPERALHQLSLRLRTTFLTEMVFSQPELASERKRVGKKKLAEIIRFVRISQEKLLKASDILRDVGFANPFANTGMPNPADRYREEFEAAIATLEECDRFFAAYHKNDLARFLATPNANKAVDMRRTILCVTIFNLWLDLGRTVSYTTDDVLKERTGPLIEFVRDVIFCLSNPPTRHNGEVIKREIDAFNRDIDSSTP